METLLWIMTFVAIAGVILNIKRYRISFVLWFISNMTFVIFNIYAKHWSQAFLWLVYASLSVWGWFEWGKKNEN